MVYWIIRGTSPGWKLCFHSDGEFKMKQFGKIFCGILLLMSGFASLASGEDRNVAVDQAIGGMEQGRRIQSPGGYNNKGITSGQPGSTPTSAHDIHTISQESEKAATSSAAKNIPVGGNQGFLYVNGQAGNSQNGTHQAAGREQTNSSTNANVVQGSTGQEKGSANAGSTQAGTEQPKGSANVNAGETSTGQTSGSVNAGTQTGHANTEPVNNPLNTGAGANAGTVETSTGQTTNNPSADTSAGTGGTASVETQGNGGVFVGGETSPTGQAGTGEINTGTSSPGTSTQESSGTSSNPIVGVETGVNQNAGVVNPGVHTDTSGQLEDRQIIGAGATAGQTSTQTGAGSATGITGQEVVHQADITTQPVTGATGQTATAETQGNGGIFVGGQTSPTSQTGTGAITTGSSSLGTSTESSGTSNNPIVGVEANVNPESGTVNTGVHTDTSGQLEDRQILGGGVTAGQTGSTGTEVGSATDITGQQAVHQLDVTTQPVTSAPGSTGTTETTSVETQGNGGILVGGETSPTSQTGTGAITTGSSSSGTSTESSGTSNNPIVGVEANVNPESGMVGAGVHTDTSGQLEDRQIIDAGATGQGTGSTGAQVGSASDITGQEVVHGADVTTQPVTGVIGQTRTAETTSVETQGNGGILVGGETAPTGEIGTGEINTGTGSSGTSTQESSSTSSNPIVGVDAGVDQNSGTANAGVTVDTSGQLEEREILDADATGETTGSAGAEVGSAADITDADLVEEADITTESVPGSAGQTTTGQTSGSVQESSSGTSNNPIVGVEAGVDQNSGMPNAGVTVDTTGEIEDRQILAVDLAAEGVSSSGAQTGSASGITGSGAVHDANITTEHVSGTTGQTVSGTTEAQTGTGSGSSGTTTQEPSGSGTSNNPIVGIEAGVDQNSGAVNTGVHVDTSGQLEDRQILGAGVTGTDTGSSETQIGSASGITGSGSVAGLDVTTQPVESLIPAPSDLGADIDTTGQTSGGEADVGIAAEVDGVSEGADVGRDPADGLSTSVPGL